jgi:4,5-dihydroxyphthalate decarboxylase
MTELSEQGTVRPSLETVSLVIGDYDRTRPLIDGRVKPEGINLIVTESGIANFCLRPIYEEYDVAEMSLSWYVMARLRGEPVLALPIFVLRMPVFAYVFVHKDSRFEKPSDLVGARIATTYYRLTVNLWLRGIFEEHYALPNRKIRWIITSEAEGAGYEIPTGIEVTRLPGRNPFALLASGEVDAVFTPELPEDFAAYGSKVKHLFPDALAETRRFYNSTGISPITHTVVVGRKFATERPRTVRRLTSAFEEAQRVCDEYWNDPKRLSFTEAAFFFQQQRDVYGANSYRNGIEFNRRTLEAFVRYAHQQKYIDHVPSLAELFFT